MKFAYSLGASILMVWILGSFLCLLIGCEPVVCKSAYYLEPQYEVHRIPTQYYVVRRDSGCMRYPVTDPLPLDRATDLVNRLKSELAK